MPRSNITALVFSVIVFLALIALAISHFDWNMSALLHISRDFGEAYSVPAGTVLYEDGGYDGMLYYQIARDLPEIFYGEPVYDNAYRWQRIFLPVLASLFSLGKDAALPFVILGINIAAVLGSLFLFLKLSGKPSIHALTLVGNPAALVGILFSLTEPLALFFTTLFLFLWKKAGERVTWMSVMALALSLLTRETTIFLIMPLLFLSFSNSQEHWNKKLLLILPLFPFACWTAFLVLHFKTLPWETSEGMLSLPLSGIFQLLRHSILSPNTYVLSSATFFLFFFLPLCFLVVQTWLKEKGVIAALLAILLGAFLFLDAHIWNVLTSVGRVIPALYPLYALWAFEHDTWKTRIFSLMLFLVSTATAIGIALTPHPFSIS